MGNVPDVLICHFDRPNPLKINSSLFLDMFFDNLTVQHHSGPLVEENSYYPHGLKIAALGSRAALRPMAKYGLSRFVQ
jgi:hypothetical protein